MRSGHGKALSTGGAVPFYLLLLSVLLTPLPFGSYYQWSWASLGLIVGLLLVHASIVLIFTRGSLPPQLKAMWIPGGLYLLVVAWIALQGLEIPWVSNSIWAQASEILGEETQRTISVDPYKTWSEFLKMLIFGGIFWLAAHYGRDPDRARSALWIVALAGTAYAFYGLLAQFTEMGAFLWFHPMPTGDSGVRSTFVNRNMYALYAGFGCLTAIALLLEKFSHGAFSTGETHWLDFVRGRSSKVIFLMTCAFFLVAALFLTTSRGGFAAAILALASLLISFGHHGEVSRSPRRAVARLSFGVIALVIAGYVIAGGDLGARLSAWEPVGSDGRFLGYRLILEAILDSPLTGYGAGTALEVFYLYSDGTFWGAFNYSHNVYLGLAVELGLPATLMLFAAIGLVGLTYLKAMRASDRIFPALGVSIIVLVAVHGLVDSPLILPANAATFSFLLGLACAQSVRSDSHPSSSRVTPGRVAPRHREPTAVHSE